MKPSTLLTAGLLAPLGAAALGLPKFHAAEDDSIPQVIRVTAFTFDEYGKPVLQCWEVSETASSSRAQKHQSSKRPVNRMSLGSTSQSELENVSLLAWGPYGTIFDTNDDYSTKAVSAFFGYSFFNILSGMVSFESKWNGSSWTDEQGARILDEYEDPPPYIMFGADNGDDWFYFEDQDSQGDERAKGLERVPLLISSTSGGNTQMLQISHTERPSHKVIHNGPCGFTGIRTPPATKLPKSMNGKGRHIDVSLQIQDL